MNVIEIIESAEKKHLQVLEKFFIEKWGNTHLNSHDVNHHHRVWRNVKELLLCTENAGTKYTSDFCNKLLIACYLHDIGMSVDPGVAHGIQSRELCKAFLLKNNIDESDFHDVMEAIEYHNDIEYNNNFRHNELLRILSSADDLDAFGYIGIYRYFEIYLARGIRPEVIGSEIKNNAGKRFQNFMLNFGTFPELVEKHRKRYQILDEFFTDFNCEYLKTTSERSSGCYG